MMFQVITSLAVFLFFMLAAVGIQFGAPWWFFFAAVPSSPVLAFGVFVLTLYAQDVLDMRARAKRRAAAAARRAKGEAL
ncbi:hypothetical protein [Aeromonas hydrophila]|uniref:hypothetical protein n=1 Tax=Aeromonas hydrophila TaxID=644 RepID=UPI00207CB6AE|nr:hypothetical protein [Aeromonas hydrophila]MCO4214596.1 hypothetical protein [Aeromonas hydrophila]HDX8441981.1 hypothetical protein [Aeromonas hydrophila]HDX8632738.1 hypothetical protein [Aeromonas hydrophila]